ncbi:MAG: hypothetical protein CMI18_05365 [Opitutaceae bacterium]|nr:hypothetical protein [Opitutaceae bacterium]
MSFLAPWFLLGAAAIAGPIIFHLIRRATRDRIQFSSTEFLRASPPRLQKKSKLQHLWLLLLRCLILALLTFGFSRPFFKQDIPVFPIDSEMKHTVLLLDESASMKRSGKWQAAKTQLINWVEENETDRQISVLGISDRIFPILSQELWLKTAPSERIALLKTVLQNREPNWGPTHMDTGLHAALDELEQMVETTGEKASKVIRIFSDFTNGARLSGLAGRDWPEDCIVEFEPTQQGETRNVGIQWLGWSKIGSGPRKARFSLITTGGNQTVTLKATDAVIGAEIASSKMVYSRVGDKRLYLFEIPDKQSNPFNISIEGDFEPFDNTYHVAPENLREANLVYLGSETVENPKGALFYIERAVNGWEDPKMSVISGDWGNNTTDLLVISQNLEAYEVEKAKKYLSQGGTALLLLKDGKQLGLIETLTGETGWQSPSLSKEYGLLGTIDFNHILFKIFANPRYNNFTNIRFWQPKAIEPPSETNSKILARFDEGPPAIVESTVGTGRLIIWGGDWTPQASQWVLSSKYVPWLQQLMETALGGPAQPTMGFVNEPERIAGNEAVVWKTLNGTISSPTAPKNPGLYKISHETHSQWVALNMPADESRIDPLSWDTWEKLGVPITESQLIVPQELAEEKAAAKNAIELEGEQKLWKWLLVTAALFLGIESLVSLSISRKGAVTAEA